MTIITNGHKVYHVYYIRRFMPKWPDKPGEKDYLNVQADSIEQANEIAHTQLAAYHERDNQWSFQLMRALTTESALTRNVTGNP